MTTMAENTDHIDLHMHTTASDGVTAPQDLLQIVRDAGVRAFAITDHDTFAGSAEIRRLLQPDDPTLITGVEVSAGEVGEDLHLLVYLFHTPFVDDDSPLGQAVAEFRRRRDTRAEKIVQRLNKNGLALDFELVNKIASGAPVGRPHIADAMLQSKLVPDYNSAFRLWIGYGKPAYVEKENMTPQEAINLAHESGGVILMAHPAINGAEERIKALVEMGLDGLEAWHPANNRSRRRRYVRLAAERGLVISGGSDYHGRNDSHGQVGELSVPYQWLENLQERAKRYN